MRAKKISLIVFIPLLFDSCKEKAPHAAAQPSGKNASSKDLDGSEKDSNDSGIERLREIDLAMSGWYLCQSNAIDLLKSFGGIDIKELGPSREEVEILDDQLVFIESIKHEFESAKSKESADEWRRLQFDAMSYLSNVSSEEKVFDMDKADYKIVIEWQKVRLVKLIEELEILQEKYPY